MGDAGHRLRARRTRKPVTRFAVAGGVFVLGAGGGWAMGLPASATMATLCIGLPVVALIHHSASRGSGVPPGERHERWRPIRHPHARRVSLAPGLEGMRLMPDEIEHIAKSLASAHRSGGVSHEAGLHRLAGMAEAEDVQEAALRILADAQVGYALSATCSTTARLLGCSGPVIAPRLDGAMLDDDTAFLLSRGISGVGAGYCFVLGRPFEDSSDGSPGGREAAVACLSCHLELHLLGRRVPPRTPLNERTATADLGLDVIHLLGPRVMDRRSRDLSAATVTVDLDRNTVARGRGADTFGSPIGAVARTARWPSERGRRLEAGDIVTTGRCTGLVSVVPGQRVRAGFEGIGAVTLNLI